MTENQGEFMGDAVVDAVAFNRAVRIHRVRTESWRRAFEANYDIQLLRKLYYALFEAVLIDDLVFDDACAAPLRYMNVDRVVEYGNKLCDTWQEAFEYMQQVEVEAKYEYETSRKQF